jgi:hypothetical protein
LRQPFGPDRVGTGKVPGASGGDALGDGGLDGSRVAATLEPSRRVSLQQP